MTLQLARPLDDRRLGTRVAGFLLQTRVADGSLARVYRAADPRAAAVKIYDRDVAAARSRAQIESLAQGQVRHASVARLLEAGTLPDGACYLVSEWIEGRPLADCIASRLSWPLIRRIIGAIGSGLGAIHGAGIVHRDLKPGNVIVPRSGEPAAVILDFSHSLVSGDARVTEAGLVLGSAAYMSPEQAAGLPLDGRSDLYALGVIAYELLCGVPPFRAVSAAELLQCHRRDPVLAPRRCAPDREIPAVAEDLVMWLLAKDRDARLPSARVLAVTLGAMALEHGALDGATLGEATL